MSNEPIPAALRFILLLFSGLVNRHQQKVIDYLLEENRVLRQQLVGRRLRLTDGQRCRLHQGLGGELIEADKSAGGREGAVVCRERLGGLLRYYHRETA